MKTPVNAREAIEELARRDEEVVEWFNRLADAADGDELEQLWEEKDSSGKSLLEVFLLRQFDGTVVMTQVLGKLLLRTRAGEVRQGAVRTILTVFNHVSERQCELARKLHVADAEAVSCWPYVFCDVGEKPDPAPGGESLGSCARPRETL